MKLEVLSLNFKYKTGFSLSNVSFSLNSGDILCIVGENGSGKSTILKCMLGFLDYKGDVLVDGLSLKEFPPYKRVYYLSGVIEEDFICYMNVYDFLLMGRVYKYGILNGPDEKDIKDLRNIINIFNLERFLNRSFNTLSKGEQKLVKIAQCLFSGSHFVLIDEINSNLDLRMSLLVLKLLKKIAKEQKKGIILTLFDLNLARVVGNRFLFLKNGKVFYYGGFEIFDNIESISKFYEIKFKKYNKIIYPLDLEMS